jgi:hypothetical protein
VDSTVVSAVEIDWIHYWKPFLYTTLGALATDDDCNGTPRNDNRYRASARGFPSSRSQRGSAFFHNRVD